MHPKDPQFCTIQTHVEVYHRCVRVIQSCTNIDQARVAESYISIYWNYVSRSLQKFDIIPSLGVKLELEDLLLQRYQDLGLDLDDV